MALMDSLPLVNSLVTRLVVEEKRTLPEVCVALKAAYPSVSRGLSERSVRRYCKANNIHSTSRFKDSVVDRIVQTNILKVGPTYGRKMMTGLLAAEGFRVAEKRVGSSLKRVCPTFHNRRVTNTQKRTNPVPYFSKYVGEKLHVDQNEKLIMFNVTHVCAVDGYSGAIVGFVTMPIKNNVIIYRDLYVNILSQYGLWDQVRVDHGCEWNLMLSVQQALAHLRNSVDKQPYCQTSSKKNHIIELMWSEVNSRINYPIKAVLVGMVDKNLLNIDDPLHLFCASWLSIKVAFVGVELFIKSWNHHSIPGRNRGTMSAHVPSRLIQECSNAVRIDQHLIPSPDDAVRAYRMNGGRITDPTNDIDDPLCNSIERQEIRFQAFSKKFPSFSTIFYKVANENGSIFVDALLFFISLTIRLSH